MLLEIFIVNKIDAQRVSLKYMTFSCSVDLFLPNHVKFISGNGVAKRIIMSGTISPDWIVGVADLIVI